MRKRVLNSRHIGIISWWEKFCFSFFFSFFLLNFLSCSLKHLTLIPSRVQLVTIDTSGEKATAADFFFKFYLVDVKLSSAQLSLQSFRFNSFICICAVFAFFFNPDHQYNSSWLYLIFLSLIFLSSLCILVDFTLFQILLSNSISINRRISAEISGYCYKQLMDPTIRDYFPLL